MELKSLILNEVPTKKSITVNEVVVRTFQHRGRRASKHAHYGRDDVSTDKAATRRFVRFIRPVDLDFLEEFEFEEEEPCQLLLPTYRAELRVCFILEQETIRSSASAAWRPAASARIGVSVASGARSLHRPDSSETRRPPRLSAETGSPL